MPKVGTQLSTYEFRNVVEREDLEMFSRTTRDSHNFNSATQCDLCHQQPHLFQHFPRRSFHPRYARGVSERESAIASSRSSLSAAVATSAARLALGVPDDDDEDDDGAGRFAPWWLELPL